MKAAVARSAKVVARNILIFCGGTAALIVGYALYAGWDLFWEAIPFSQALRYLVAAFFIAVVLAVLDALFLKGSPKG